MKLTLTRLGNISIPFFKGTAIQCQWKLRRHVVNLDTIMVNGIPAIQWLITQPTPEWNFKTSITGFTLHFRQNLICDRQNFIRAFKRAEKRFATTF